MSSLGSRAYCLAQCDPNGACVHRKDVGYAQSLGKVHIERTGGEELDAETICILSPDYEYAYYTRLELEHSILVWSWNTESQPGAGAVSSSMP